MEFIRTRLPDVMNSFRLPLPDGKRLWYMHLIDQTMGLYH
jgi:hypothetical protein